MKRLPLKKHCSIYFAGRVNESHSPDFWRTAFGVKQQDDGSVACHVFGEEFGHQSTYCGPLISICHSGYAAHDGFATAKPHNAQLDVKDQCLSDIRDADLIVAKLDTGAYGTMWECGYAHALDKRIITLVCDEQLWFAAPGHVPPSGYFAKWQDGWKGVVNRTLAANYRLACWAVDSCESPLELLVCEELHKTCWHLSELILSLLPQYRIAGYRLDLACPAKKLAFEFDGFSYHAKREQFNRDRERDRALSDLGWKTVRFHGDEIRQSPSRIVDAIRKECCDSYRADCGLPVLEEKREEAAECIA
jgi:very-short-patch-repair endonuclease